MGLVGEFCGRHVCARQSSMRDDVDVQDYVFSQICEDGSIGNSKRRQQFR